MIEVILLERIERLGKMGDVVKVRPGFARNYLMPQNKALRATKANIEIFEASRAELEAKNDEQRTLAEVESKKIEGKKFIIIRQASDMGHLYGSVTARDIAEASKEEGFALDRHMVKIDTPIKSLGLVDIKIILHPEVSVKVIVNVARSKEEAAVQEAKASSDAKVAAKEAKEASEKAKLDAIGTEEAPVAEAPSEKTEEEKA